MRRRSREADPTTGPPAELLTFTGKTNRDKLAWLRARQLWWDDTHGGEHSHDLDWLFDGHDQVGDFHWCGSVGAPCSNPDCLCVVWPEHLELELSDELNRIPAGPAPRPTEGNYR